MGHMFVLLLVGASFFWYGGWLGSASVVNWYHSLVHWHPSVALTYHLYVVLYVNPEMLQVFVPRGSDELELSWLPILGLVSIVQLTRSFPSESDNVTLKVEVLIDTPVLPLMGFSDDIEML